MERVYCVPESIFRSWVRRNPEFILPDEYSKDQVEVVKNTIYNLIHFSGMWTGKVDDYKSLMPLLFLEMNNLARLAGTTYRKFLETQDLGPRGPDSLLYYDRYSNHQLEPKACQTALKMHVDLFYEWLEENSYIGDRK